MSNNLSGLQKNVLKLYRDLLRTAKNKDTSLQLYKTGLKVTLKS